MSLFDALTAGQRLDGMIPGEAIQLLTVARHGSDAAELILRKADGSVDARVLTAPKRTGSC